MGTRTAARPGDELALQSWLWQKADRALNAPDSDLSERRQELLDIYLGQPYGDEQEGFSRVLTREVFEAVEWTMPSLTRVFLGGNPPVSYAPVGEEDAVRSKQETAYVAHLLKKTDNYYETCTQWMRSTLVYPNSYAKVWWQTTREGTVTEYLGQTELQLAILANDPETQILDVMPRGEVILDPETAQTIEIEVFDIRARHATTRGRLMFAPVPPEEVLLDNDIVYQNLDEAEWVCHHRRAPRTELVQMGMDPDVVFGLPTAENLEYSSEKENRARYHDEDPHYSDDFGSMEKVDLYESYGYYDFDGDGVAEYRKMVFAGSSGKHGTSILLNEETDYQPLLSMATTPQPHRHPGVPMAEMQEHIQRNNTVLARKLNDNLYRTINPRQFADEERVNMDELFNYAPFGVVSVQGDPRTAVSAEQIPVIVGPALEAIKFWKEEGTARTGVSRFTQGLDADTLAKSTMGAFMGAIGQASARLEQVVRDMAETGFVGLYRKAHHLVRKHQDVADTFELRGEWIDVDPRDWMERKQVVATVGAGTGSQQERIGANMALLDVQKEAYTAGLASRRQIYNTLEDLASAMGKDVSRVFTDPDSDEGRQLMEQLAEEQRAAAEAQGAPMQAAAQAQQAETQRRRTADQERSIIDLQQLRLDAEKEENRSEERRAELELKYGTDVPGSAV